MQDHPGTLEERFMITYKKVLEPVNYNKYKPRKEPFVPDGWPSDYADYTSLKDNNKSKGWQSLMSKYSGYIKRKDEVTIQNKSDAAFFEQMYDFFVMREMSEEAELCQQKINEYKTT